MELKQIAHIITSFPTKFGIPRQSGLAPSTIGKIVFEEEYRIEEAVRGLEEFTHLWLIWGFSENKTEAWRPTVRPPRLGGNTRKGVFATRSPNRPNPIALSSVKLLRIEKGPVLIIEGPDMVSGTPIYDIKPYIPYSDCHIDAKGSFSSDRKEENLEVVISDELLKSHDETLINSIIEVISQDPRPHYQEEEDRVYSFLFDKYDVSFKVANKTATVLAIKEVNS